jgi:tRNA (guanine-N7-)-methyltransferase
VSVRRARRLPLEELAPYLLEVPETPRPFDWTAVFGNNHPVEVEVGFGKGLFLVTAGQANPHVNFLGIEIARKYQLFTATRLAKRGLRNVRLAKADARIFLRDLVQAASCRAVHVYFPDPWWKKRHLKRRVFTGEFAVQCERILQPGGHLRVVTDVADYYEIIKALMGQNTRLQPIARNETEDSDFSTNFERKFRMEGRPIYRAVYERAS